MRDSGSKLTACESVRRRNESFIQRSLAPRPSATAKSFAAFLSMAVGHCPQAQHTQWRKSTTQAHTGIPALAIPSNQQMIYASANPVTTLHVTTRHDFA
jgi:hypothetical protein